MRSTGTLEIKTAQVLKLLTAAYLATGEHDKQAGLVKIRVGESAHIFRASRGALLIRRARA